jgi:outer membrane receptor protein involved in Fe transport
MKRVRFLALRGCAAVVGFGAASGMASVAQAQDTRAEQAQADADGEIVVTAQRRSERLLDVPASVDVLSGDRLQNRFSGGESILALAGATPGLYVESSSGRTAPRFYIRGLGNSDFNQAASQPVSVLQDEVPVEKSGFRSFPIFDLERVEVIRGPQGTLFGRNTIAGVVRLESRRPTNEFEGYVRAAGGNLGIASIEAAVGGPIVYNRLSFRLSALSQNRANWIDNGFSGQRNAIGGFDELAGRVQLLWTPSEQSSARLLYVYRRLGGNSSTPFRANVLTRGSNRLNANYDRDTVFYDGGGNQASDAEQHGITLEIRQQLGTVELTSVTSYQDLFRFGRADVDGGFGPGPNGRGPGFIPFPVDTGTRSRIDQFTHESRLASAADAPVNFQAGVFLFSDHLDFEDLNAAEPSPAPGQIGVRTTSVVENDSWAVFGQVGLVLSEQWRGTVGLRYTDDRKRARFGAPPTSSSFNLVQTIAPIRLSGDHLSWDAALTFQPAPDAQLYARVASGFRAPTIQTAVRTDPDLTTADTETILSGEVGFKIDRGSLRFAATAYYYEVSGLQLTAVGGDDPTGGIGLLNADKGIGYGVELDAFWRANRYVRLSGGFGYTKTRLREAGLSTGVCAACTVLDPRNALGRAVIDGNPFPQAPLWTANFEADFRAPVSPDGELFLFTDWRLRGRTSFFLYDSIEYVSGTQADAGLRVGYRDRGRGLEIAGFARNLLDADNVLGGIDFNNLTAYVNEPRVIGVELVARF